MELVANTGQLMPSSFLFACLIAGPSLECCFLYVPVSAGELGIILGFFSFPLLIMYSI